MPIDLRPLTAQSADARRGSRVILYPDKLNKVVQIFEFGNECARADVLGVTFGLECHAGALCVPEGELFALPAVRAHLEWGIGCANFFAIADVGNGTVLSVTGECLKVCVEYIVWGDRCAGWLPDLKVSAGVSYGASSGFPAKLTELVFVPAGERAAVAIPPFAQSFIAVPIAPAPEIISGSVTGPQGTPRVRFDVPGAPIELPHHGHVPLFNGATCVEVDNTEGASPVSAFIIFELAL